jgi:hypothetical protein
LLGALTFETTDQVIQNGPTYQTDGVVLFSAPVDPADVPDRGDTVLLVSIACGLLLAVYYRTGRSAKQLCADLTPKVSVF